MEEEPVAICRLKRVAFDNSDDIAPFLPAIPEEKNGKRVALIGGGPASLTVARDLMPLGYDVTLIERDAQGGGMMRSQIPSFRLPESVLDGEVDRILDFGVETRFGEEVSSLKSVLDEGFDAVFVGTGAPRGRDLDLPGRAEADANIHIGIDWLMSVAFGHTEKIGRRVIVLGGGNTAMDCCRTAKRLGGDESKSLSAAKGRDEGLTLEIEDALAEDVDILNNHVPLEFLVEDGRLVGVAFDRWRLCTRTASAPCLDG